MGLFGGSKRIYVSSVVYNLAGEEEKRPNFLKTAVVGSVLAGSPSIADDISKSYLRGPAIRFRQFARWAKSSGYSNAVGVVNGTITKGTNVNTNVLVPFLPTEPGFTPVVQEAVLGEADPSYWADQYVAQNFPERLSTLYVSDYIPTTNRIHIRWEGGGENIFIPSGYDARGEYMYVTYSLFANELISPIEEGSWVNVGSGSLPSISGWELVSNTTNTINTNLNTVTQRYITYSDGRPAENTSDTVSTPISYTNFQRKYERRESTSLSNSIQYLLHIMYQEQGGIIDTDVQQDTIHEDIGGGVTRTTTTTILTDYLTYSRRYRNDTQQYQSKAWTGVKIYIYRKGSGNPTLDAMFDPTEPMGDFYPFIPFRANNQFVSERWPSDIYPLAQKAFKKATGGRYKKVEDSIADNESLEDIDYAYAVFGVSLNVLENDCKKYIYYFLKSLSEDYTLNSRTDYNTWKTNWNNASSSIIAWDAWRGRRQDEGWLSPLDPEPLIIPYPQIPRNSIRVSSASNHIMNFDMRLSWQFIEETTLSGQAWAGAKKGQVRIIKTTSEDFNQYTYMLFGTAESGYTALRPTRMIRLKSFAILFQTEENQYIRMDVHGLAHKNLIYGGKSVDIDSHEALDDPEESGFIIPLHEQAFRDAGLKNSTQMSTACCFMVFNCYQVVRSKWYQSGLFQIIIVIAAVVITVYSGGAGAGLLGPSITVGTSMGFTGLTAAIVGAVANALAAMIVVQIIQAGAKALFGDKLGAIIGAIVSMIAIQVGTEYMNGGDLAFNFGNLMKAENLMKLTSTGAGAYSDYLQASAAEIGLQTQELMENYKVEAGIVKAAWEQNLGYGQGVISPLAFTEAFGATGESVESFLSRTLMTGMDIADMSLEMIRTFSDITLSTELA